MQFRRQQQQGFTFVEVIIVTSIMVMVFGALFASFQYSLRLINVSRAKLSALSVANDRMEYFRSLPYDDVGTIAGIPPGTIPQSSIVTLNNINFTERVLVEYVDDPADGQDTATTSDSNAIPSDYKRIRLEYAWDVGGTPGEIFMVSNIVPRSIETTAGGGTVRINVIDENSVLLPGASVRLINSTATATVDVTRVADAGGTALFSGAPAGSGYEAIVTGPIGGYDYSIDRTYEATTTNPTPVSAPFTVVEADVSTLTFQIGRLSDFLITLYTDVTEDRYVEDFSDFSGVASSSLATSTGSELVLAETGGIYESSGIAYLGPVSPGSLTKWGAVRVAADVPNDTTYKVQFLTGPAVGPYTLIPEGDLPGNAVGFTDTIVDISELDSGVYPEIIVSLTLETTNTAFTPFINELSVEYVESETPLQNTNFSLQGNKIIGLDAGGLPIYKFSTSSITDASGQSLFPAIEFDLYSVTVGGYDAAAACPDYPFSHTAGIDGEFSLELTPDEAHSLRVMVVDSLGRAVPGVSATLTRPGYSETFLTGLCGQVFFPGDGIAQTDFSLELSSTGYQTQTISNVTVDGDVFLSVNLVAD